MIKNEEFKKLYFDVIKYYTNIDLNNYDMIDNELNSGTDEVKDYRLDIVFRKDNHTVIVEMESNNTITSDIKDYQYLYRTAGNQFASGEKYTSKKVSLIKFNDYGKDEKYIDDKMLNYKFEDKDHNLIKEDIESFEIILPYFHKKTYNESSNEEKFLWLFTCEWVEKMKQEKLIKEHRAFIEELERLSMDDMFLYAYDHEKVHKKMCNSLYDEGKEIGLQQGIEKKTKEDAINLYKNGVSKELIMKSLNISLEVLNSYLEEE